MIIKLLRQKKSEPKIAELFGLMKQTVWQMFRQPAGNDIPKVKTLYALH